MHMFHPGMAPPKGTKLDRTVVRRAWTFGAPFRRHIYGYLFLVAITSALGVLPALVFRRLIDNAIPNKDLASVTRLSFAAVSLALLSALIGVVIRYFSSIVGEGVIAELRKALYDHIQRLPIAFFTRTQTGALMSRVNNDVVGAQSAYTFILRTVVADVLVVVFTLLAMLQLSWRITIVSLLAVPFLIWLSRSVGEKAQKAAREAMTKNAAMNTVMTERFNVSGALLVKLFGRPTEESTQFGVAADEVAVVTGPSMGVALYRDDDRPADGRRVGQRPCLFLGCPSGHQRLNEAGHGGGVGDAGATSLRSAHRTCLGPGRICDGLRELRARFRSP